MHHQHTNTVERVASNDTRCSADTQTGQTSDSDRSDRLSPGTSAMTNEHCPGRTHRGRRTQGCSRVGGPPRTPSIDVETKEEYQIVDWKIRAKRKDKKNKSCIFD